MGKFLISGGEMPWLETGLTEEGGGQERGVTSQFNRVGFEDFVSR